MDNNHLLNKTVLIIEKVNEIATLVRSQLEDYGAIVSEVCNINEVISTVSLKHYDFILIDISDSNFDGFAIAKQIKICINNHTTLFALSSDCSKEIIQNSRNVGMYSVINPFCISQLNHMSIMENNLSNTKCNFSSQKLDHWLKLMYIANIPEVALIAEKYGVDRIWIDLETIGKEIRQPGNTVKSHHSPDDIRKLKQVLSTSEILVRVEPWNCNSKSQIDQVIEYGADIVMLPMWKSIAEVKEFIECVGGRTKTSLLLETKEAVECIDEVLQLGGFDEIHIGLNDLHISYGLDFMFELLPRGDVEYLCEKIKAYNIPYGFGGIAHLGNGDLKAENVIMEHRRLGSSRAILSRSFCNISEVDSYAEVEEQFKTYMKELFEFEEYCLRCSEEDFIKNKSEIAVAVKEIAANMREKKQ